VGGWKELWTSRAALCVAVFAIAAVTATMVPQTALGEERSCRGTLGRVTVDNLRVPQGAACTLNGTRVRGAITVQRAARLVANGVRVTGNVQAENARNVVIRRRSLIGGSVQLVQGGRATVQGSRVNGDIHLDENRGPLRVRRNAVGGSIQVVRTRAASRSSGTGSAATSSARRIARHRRAVGTGSGRASSTSAHGSEAARLARSVVSGYDGSLTGVLGTSHRPLNGGSRPRRRLSPAPM
jgi:hypothetical protein